MDSGNIERPWKAPSALIALNTVFAFANLLFMGAGAKVWQVVGAKADAPNPLWIGIIFAALIIPVFYFRHFVQDGGKFPAGALEDIGLRDGDMGAKKAGMLPYAALGAGVVLVLWANWFFQLPI